MTGNWKNLALFELTSDWQYSVPIVEPVPIFLFRVKSQISPNKAYALLCNACLESDFLVLDKPCIFYPETSTQIVSLASPSLLLPEFTNRAIAARLSKNYYSQWIISVDYFCPDPNSELANGGYAYNLLSNSSSSLSLLLGIY